MIKLVIELKGNQTPTHCSLTSSIGSCDKLNTNSDRCLIYKSKLKYDWPAHAYKRCAECIEGEVKEGKG